MTLPLLDARRLTPLQAVDALATALRAGLDPEADPPRTVLDVPGGQLLARPPVTDRLVALADVVRGTATLPPGPRLFKSTGMSWEDAVVAGALLDA